MTHAIVGRWGKNLAVRFPNEIASEVGLHDGERVEIEAGINHIVIRRAKPVYSLEQMFAEGA